ncbi:MAG: transposase [Sphingobacteriales bacterium]|nr:transposase [Sphingobacteriales bacterium]
MDLFDADCLFQANQVAKAEQVAQYFADLSLIYQNKGIKKVVVYLDNNRTHKDKMKTIYQELTAQLNLEIDFRYLTPYSLKLNLVEYAIHLIRLNVTHNADCKDSLQKFEQHINELTKQKIFTKNQIVNILQHIDDLINKN